MEQELNQIGMSICEKIAAMWSTPRHTNQELTHWALLIDNVTLYHIRNSSTKIEFEGILGWEPDCTCQISQSHFLGHVALNKLFDICKKKADAIQFDNTNTHVCKLWCEEVLQEIKKDQDAVVGDVCLWMVKIKTTSAQNSLLADVQRNRLNTC